jgi:hypothetical protein
MYEETTFHRHLSKSERVATYGASGLYEAVAQHTDPSMVTP